MPEDLQLLVEHLAKQLVDHPDEVSVRQSTGGRGGEGSEQGDLYELSVNPDDLGHVIGRQGRTARAIRSVVRAAAAKQGHRAQVEIVE